MQLTLSPEETALLRQVLLDRVSDLRMEISSTERYDLRKDLQRDEVVLRSIVARLVEAQPSVGPDLRVA